MTTDKIRTFLQKAIKAGNDTAADALDMILEYRSGCAVEQDYDAIEDNGKAYIIYIGYGDPCDRAYERQNYKKTAIAIV